MEEYTVDSLFNKKINISQPRDGYRFSMDSVVLCAHVTDLCDKTILEIGTGCGIVPIILGFRFPKARIIGIEIQKSLADIAKKNVTANQMDDRISIWCKDVKSVQPKEIMGKADVIVTNPPYKKKDSGRLNPSAQKAVARHEILLNLDELIQKSHALLKSKGQIHIIYPAERFTELISSLVKHKLTPSAIRFVHPQKQENAKRVLVSAVKEGFNSCTIKPPLYIYNSNKTYTKEYSSIFDP